MHRIMYHIGVNESIYFFLPFVFVYFFNFFSFLSAIIFFQFKHSISCMHIFFIIPHLSFYFYFSLFFSLFLYAHALSVLYASFFIGLVTRSNRRNNAYELTQSSKYISRVGLNHQLTNCII